MVGRVPSRGVLSRIQAQYEISGIARVFTLDGIENNKGSSFQNAGQKMTAPSEVPWGQRSRVGEPPVRADNDLRP